MLKQPIILALSLLVSLLAKSQQQPVLIPAYDPSISINSIKTLQAKVPVASEEDLSGLADKDVICAYKYFDGIGRPMQTVLKSGGKDINGNLVDVVVPVSYDLQGVEKMKFLPYNSTGSDGSFHYDPFFEQQQFNVQQYGAQGETFYYGQTEVEPSPLLRPKKVTAPGNNWTGTNTGTVTHYLFNTQTNDDVKIWQVNALNNYEVVGAYADGTLSKTIVTDEHASMVVEYRDMENKVLLKKVQAGDGASANGDGYHNWLSTYYVYDEYNLLRLVIQPKAVGMLLVNDNWTLTPDMINDLCFVYEYDQKNRMVTKKAPGAAAVSIVYDIWDRVVLTQDGKAKDHDRWVFNKYDYFNRPIYTGIYYNGAEREELQALLTLNGNFFKRYETVDFNYDILYTYKEAFPVFDKSPEELLTINYYDDYSCNMKLGSDYAQLNTASEAFFQAPSNSDPYPQPVSQSGFTKGLVTAMITYLLKDQTSDTKRLISSIFYDDRGRVQQAITDNITGGRDVITTQYNFAGQPLESVIENEIGGSNPQHNTVISKMEYDELSRLARIRKQVIHDESGQVTDSYEKVIVENEYDELGRLKKKLLGKTGGEADNPPVETLSYDYNIRGWLLGINRSYLDNGAGNTSSYFGMELAYDKSWGSDNSVVYSTPQFNGNIAGISWKSKGDLKSRKYDFTYDRLNRLLEADFTQKSSSNNTIVWDNNKVDYSVIMGNGKDYYTAYDENGNILRMRQWGLDMASGKKLIDDLAYTYTKGGQTNQLLNVIDAFNDPGTKLGDFRTSENHPQAQLKLEAGNENIIKDYEYDSDGNLQVDANKEIDKIDYNLLNLPNEIFLLDGKSHIRYVYGADGQKLSKITVDGKQPGKIITTTTTYIGCMVFESREVSYETIPSNPEPTYENRLIFVSHEEGRVRFNPVTGEQADLGLLPSLSFDYFIKDHLGNVRMVLTEDQKRDNYPAATMEETGASTEESFYANLSQTRSELPAGYPTDNSHGSNARVAKIGGAGTIGPSMILKVMAGDHFNVSVSSWYRNTGVQPQQAPVSPFNELFGALITGISGASAGGSHAISEGALESGQWLNPGLSDFLGYQSQQYPGANKPKAFLNWVLFDEQFNFVESSSGADPVGENEELKLHVKTELPVNANGYLYIYVSNETPNINVYFDNLEVTHITGALLEETHYYPFGLTMAGISSKAAGITPNKIKYNNMELQSGEFSDGIGLEMYEYKYRFYDHQIGRFISQDALADKYPHYAPYQFAGNQVPNAIDLDGLEEFRVNDNDDGTKTVTLHRVDAPFSVQYNGQKLDAFPQQNMNDFYRNNLVVQGNSDATGGIASVKHVDGNGQVVQTFYDNTPGTKDANLDQASFNFPGEKPLNMQSVPTLGTESNGTLLQSSNVENKNISNSNTVGIPIGGDGTAVLNYSSMGSDPKTFNVTNTTSAGTVLWQASFTGTSGTGSPAVLSLQPGTMLNITVTQPATNTNTNYNYNVRQLDVTTPVNKILPVN